MSNNAQQILSGVHATYVKMVVQQPPPPEDEETILPVEKWFRRRTSGDPRVVPYHSIAHHADVSYTQWRTVHEKISHYHDFKDKLFEWLANVPLDELTDTIAKTPSGLVADENNDAFDFTPWQRVSMAVYSKLPFDVTSTVKVSAEDLRVMAQYTRGEGKRSQDSNHCPKQYAQGVLSAVRHHRPSNCRW